MDDLEFVQKCVERDRQSWHEFVERYSHLIYRYIHGVIRLKGTILANPDTISDIFQEIFTSLIKDDFRKLRSFRAKNGCSLASWLRQVTIHATIDYIRRIKATVSLDEEDEEGRSLAEVIPDEAESVNDVLLDQERMISLADCIKQLEPDDRYFLELHLNQNMSLGEVKEALRISRGAVDMRKSRILKRLKDCFRSKGFRLDF